MYFSSSFLAAFGLVSQSCTVIIADVQTDSNAGFERQFLQGL
jgi:hypothetical protein